MNGRSIACYIGILVCAALIGVFADLIMLIGFETDLSAIYLCVIIVCASVACGLAYVNKTRPKKVKEIQEKSNVVVPKQPPPFVASIKNACSGASGVFLFKPSATVLFQNSGEERTVDGPFLVWGSMESFQASTSVAQEQPKEVAVENRFAKEEKRLGDAFLPC